MQKTSRKSALGRPKSLEKRLLILECASHLLLELGYKNTTMNAVANESGVSKQTVYSHFNNKEALFNAVIENKCEMYQVEEASIYAVNEELSVTLSKIGLSFIKLLNDVNVISMYKVVISESKQDSNLGQLFYDAGPIHSIKLVIQLLLQHPECALSEKKAQEVSIDFFNLLKSDYHMRGMLTLPYKLSETAQQALAERVALKTMAIINIV